jgi:hypothetical protein
MNPKLHEVDLVTGEEEVGGPDRPCQAVEPGGRAVVRRGAGRGQSSSADHLRDRAAAAAGPLDRPLQEEGERGGGADPQQTPTAATPE